MKLIRYLCFIGLGILMAEVGVGVLTWQFWVVMALAGGIQISAALETERR